MEMGFKWHLRSRLRNRYRSALSVRETERHAAASSKSRLKTEPYYVRNVRQQFDNTSSSVRQNSARDALPASLTKPKSESANVVFPGISYTTYFAVIGLAVALL